MILDHFVADDNNSRKNLSDDSAIALLTDLIHRDLNKFFSNISSSVIIAGELWGGQETARTFRFKVSSGSAKEHIIFIKICPTFEKLNPAKLEYETLQLLYEKMPQIQDDCYVSRPLAYYSELNAYAMESVGTESLKPYLLKHNSYFRSGASSRKLNNLIAGCARWLTTFHQITASNKPIFFSASDFREKINQDWDLRKLSDYRFPRELISDIDGIIHSLDALEKIELPCAKWHWDYTPGHVFIARGRISVIDILGMDDIPIYEDIGHFLAAMTCINNLPYYPFFNRRSARTKLCDIFAESYRSGTSFSKDNFDMFINLYKLKYLIIYLFGQHELVSRKINPLAGALFANWRTVPLMRESMSECVRCILDGMHNMSR